MVFKNKFPEGYHRDTATLELWFQQRNMNQREKEAIANNYLRVLRESTVIHVTQQSIECDPTVYLVDYSALSCVTLDSQKNRYLLDSEGNYYEYGFLMAKNVVDNLKYAMLVKNRQITDTDFNEFTRLIRNQTKKANLKFVVDNRHNQTLRGYKKQTMLIEVEFGGLKTKLYKQLKPLQHTKANKIVTDTTITKLLEQYRQRLSLCGFILVKPLPTTLEPTSKKAN